MNDPDLRAAVETRLQQARMSGRRLGVFAVGPLLGVGGMGEVYRARDTRLGRDVALKILPPLLTDNPTRLARFEREAQLLAALSHPNIAGIYRVEDSDSTIALVLELVEGDTLAERLHAVSPTRRCGLPWSDAKPIAQQIVEGLHAAHQRGVIHRDLKPANIKITPDGVVKILDFGLAKAVATGGSTETPSQATTEVSQEGQFLGTPAYMSPEQVRGLPANPKVDIWALGCVLFELLTGRRPFAKDTVSDTIAAILEREPDWTLLPATTPVHVRGLVQRCLTKDPDQRLATVAEARAILAEAPLRRGRGRVPMLATTLLLLGVVGAVSTILRHSPAADVSVATSDAPLRVVALLPFDTTSASPDDRAYARGITAALTEQLRRAATLATPAASLLIVPSAEISEGDLTTLERARRTLGADIVLTGQVTRAGDRRRIAITRHQFDSDTDASTGRGANSDGGKSGAVLDWDDSISVPLVSVRRLTELSTNLGLAPVRSAGEMLAAGGTLVGRAEDAYFQGLGYLSGPDADLDRALSNLETATTLDPQFALAFSATTEALLLKHLGRPDTALLVPAARNADIGISLAPQLAAPHVVRGNVYRTSAQNELAIREFREALRLDDGAPGARRRLAEVLEADGDTSAAEQTYRQQIAASPHYWSPYVNFGSFLIRYGRYRDAETNFVTALKYAPDNPRAIGNLAGLYILTERLTAAETELRRAIALRPDVLTYNNLAWVEVYQERFADAVPLMEQAVRLPRMDSFYLGNLARMYRWAGRRSDAQRTYDRALALARDELARQPADLRLRGNYAQMLAEVGRGGDAISEISAALKLGPGNVSVLFRKALVHELSGDRRAALDALQAAANAGYSRIEIRRHPDLARLRADPAYVRIASTVPPPDAR